MAHLPWQGLGPLHGPPHSPHREEDEITKKMLRVLLPRPAARVTTPLSKGPKGWSLSDTQHV